MKCIWERGEMHPREVGEIGALLRIKFVESRWRLDESTGRM